MPGKQVFICSSSSRSRCSPAAILSFSAATSAISASAFAGSPPLPFALPISFEAALRRACMSCSAFVLARRSSSSSRMPPPPSAAARARDERSGTSSGFKLKPRRARPASKSCGIFPDPFEIEHSRLQNK